MLHSSIKAGLCAVFASAAALTGSALAQEATPAPLQAEAAHRLALHAAEGLPVERHLAFQARLDECATDMGACAALLADLQTYTAPEGAFDPVRLIRSSGELLPGSDGEIVGVSGEAAATPSEASRPQALDTQAPVIVSFTLQQSTVTVDQGETRVSVDYEITDEGGSYLEEMLVTLRNQDTDITAPDIRVGQFTLGGNRATGTVSVDLSPYVRDGEYQLSIIVWDNADNFSYSENGPILTINNANADVESPVLDDLRITPKALTIDEADAQLSVDFSIRDPGLAGLDYITFGLRGEQTSSGSPSIGHVLLNMNGEDSLQGRVRLTVPAATPSGEYTLRIVARDLVGNDLFLDREDPTGDRTVVIENPNSDTTPPVVHRLTLTPDAVETSGFGATVRVDYNLTDENAGLDYLWLSLLSSEPGQRNSRLLAPLVRFNAAPRATGSFNWSLPANFPAGSYYVEASLQDEVGNLTGDGYMVGVTTTQLLWVNAPGKRAFGPFVGVVEPDGEGRDIFRVTGLETGPPSRIQVAFRDPEIYGFEGEFSDCDLEIQPARHSGAEYLILAQDLAACGAFGSADVVFQITPDPADLDERIALRRFRISETGMLSDQNLDRSPLSRWGEQPGEITFGPFEWTETPASGRLHHFRLSGLEDSIPQSMDIAIANAAADGFDGAFGDCTLDVPLSAVTQGVYAFTSADLAACGDFGRADLSFRFTDIASYSDAVTLSRLVTTAQGAVTDFSFDQLTDLPIRPENLTGGRVRIEAGPFEWTGGPNAPTQNLFRISGLTSLPDQIEVAVANAAVSGYDGAYSDCNLTLRSNRSGANDYLIASADLADCGDFGRADLSFRITASQAAMTDGARVRRIAIGAHGDLTDFNFDHDVRPTGEIREGGNGQSNIVLGPFEWTGDHTVGTQNVFRITGITGAPTRIQAALADATSGSYNGSYFDCELTIRPERASANDYVITSNDLADCGNFSRANITFRVHANTEDFQSDVQMRRFAVTRTGGLTDFSFDNQ